MVEKYPVRFEEIGNKKLLLSSIFLAFGAYILYNRIVKSPTTSSKETNSKNNFGKINTGLCTESCDPISEDCSTATQGGCSISSTADSNDIKRDRPVSEKQSTVVSQYINTSLQKNIK
uniref:Uncharacterized protein n=1 Tax=Strongyloides stercoralis TaxID=6248 RepID=A0A0K0DYF6_STRER